MFVDSLIGHVGPFNVFTIEYIDWSNKLCNIVA